MSDLEFDTTRLSRDHAARADERSAAVRTVLHGIDRGLFDAAGARVVLEHLGLLVPLRVPKTGRAT